jgi:hypothetical protein
VSGIPEKMLAIARSLDEAGIAFAFGGALALAWCTERARGTVDIDVNVFGTTDQVPAILAALPRGIAWSPADVDRVERDGQDRLWWDITPIDLFLNTTPFHDQLGERARWERFAGRELPFLSCSDLAVFKVFFNRTRDWADLEEMASAGTLDLSRIAGVLASYLGPHDERITRLRSLAG